MAANLHALLETEGKGALPSGLRLSESGRATEGSGSGAVSNTHNANILGTAYIALTSHTLGHLDLHGEFGIGSQRETAKAEAWDILGNLGGLESTGVGASRGGIDVS